MTARDCSLLARGTYVFSSGFSLHVKHVLLCTLEGVENGMQLERYLQHWKWQKVRLNYLTYKISWIDPWMDVLKYALHQTYQVGT